MAGLNFHTTHILNTQIFGNLLILLQWFIMLNKILLKFLVCLSPYIYCQRLSDVFNIVETKLEQHIYQLDRTNRIQKEANMLPQLIEPPDWLFFLLVYRLFLFITDGEVPGHL